MLSTTAHLSFLAIISHWGNDLSFQQNMCCFLTKNNLKFYHVLVILCGVVPWWHDCQHITNTCHSFIKCLIKLVVLLKSGYTYIHVRTINGLLRVLANCYSWMTTNLKEVVCISSDDTKCYIQGRLPELLLQQSPKLSVRAAHHGNTFRHDPNPSIAVLPLWSNHDDNDKHLCCG